MSKAFNEIFKKSKRKPSMLCTDKGNGCIIKHFKEFLKKEKIKLYHTEMKKNQVLLKDGTEQ